MGRLRKYAPVIALALVVPISAVIWWTVMFGRLTPSVSRTTPKEPEDSAPELVRIEPGTVVEDSLPKGWSSRIIKTVMKLQSGDVGSLPEFASVTATRIRTVVLADVRKGPRGYVLRRLGVGLAMHHDGHDQVVSSDTLGQFGVKFSTLDKIVLKRAEQALDKGRIAARTPTFVVYDAAIEYLQENRHQSIYLRYAVEVDRQTGRVRTLVWPIAQDPLQRKPPEEVVLLPPNALFLCGVHVQASRLPGGIPVAWYFAMDGLPPGERLPLPPQLRTWSTFDPKTGPQSTQFEAVVRGFLETTRTNLRSPSLTQSPASRPSALTEKN